jgi:hypothetical protein
LLNNLDKSLYYRRNAIAFWETTTFHTTIDLLQKSIFAPLAPKKKRLRPYSSPLLGENERGGGNRIQSPPELGDLGGFPGFMQEV